MSKSINLGPRESTLILELEKQGSRIFTFQEAKQLLNTSESSVANVIHRLKKKNRIQKIEKGKYVLSPAKSGVEGHWTENTQLIVESLLNEYYIGFWSAMEYWNMTEQIPQTTQVALTKRKRDIEYGNQKIKFITITENRFFGETKQKVKDSTYKIASKEKTILDGLTYPQHCGGIPEVTKAIWNTKGELNWKKLIKYLEKLNINAVTRRLGYILETLKIKKDIRQRIKEDFKGFRWLDPSTKKKKIKYNKDWGLKLNLKEKELTEWREC